MNYDNLTTKEATNRLREHDEADWSDDRLWDEVIEPSDVLYYLDAFGDQSLAINCQGLPKDLSDDVIKTIDEYDVLNDWQGGINKTECPVCNRGFLEFDWKYDYLYIDEYGDTHDFVEYLMDSAAQYWDSTGEHKFMCEHCAHSDEFHSRKRPSVNEVRVFYGEQDKYSNFSYVSSVIHWNFLHDYNENSTDLFNLRSNNGDYIDSTEIATSFAQGHSTDNDVMENAGYDRIHVKELDESCTGHRKLWRHAEDVLTGWAKLTRLDEPTHPDFDFTYIIEGRHQAWVPEKHMDQFKDTLIQQSLRENGNYNLVEA